MVYGLKEDLNISGVQVSTALTMFFITYILFEIPWNITLKRLTPRVWRTPFFYSSAGPWQLMN